MLHTLLPVHYCLYIIACRRGLRLLRYIGCLDVVSYALYCLGFALCGTGLAIGMFAATSQTATALLSRIILKRRLSWTQILAVHLQPQILVVHYKLDPKILQDAAIKASLDSFLLSASHSYYYANFWLVLSLHKSC